MSLTVGSFIPSLTGRMAIGGSYKRKAHCSTRLIVVPASMTMSTRNVNNIFPLTGLCLCFVLLVNAEIDASCPGPRQHYEEIGCTPVFKTPDAKCPERYNCDHLKSLPTDKCFLNGHTYEIGEQVRDEDKQPCDIGCTCSSGYRGMRFNCAAVDCFARPEPGCYLKRNATNCCSGPQACPAKPEDVPTCVVDGKTYKDGEYFEPAGAPGTYCYCAEGYTGQNVAPFCVTRQKSVCGTMLRHADDVRNNCVPTFYYNQSPQTECSLSWRCQNGKDEVIKRNASGESKSATSEPANPDMQCIFGNLTMNVGDELNQATYWDSVCIKCVCEVPPVLTCQRLSDLDCDVTKHPDFYQPL